MNRPVLFIAAALVCFVVCFLLAINAVAGGNFSAWLAAGLAFFTAAHLP
jgi:hypothetical protein